MTGSSLGMTKPVNQESRRELQLKQRVLGRFPGGCTNRKDHGINHLVYWRHLRDEKTNEKTSAKNILTNFCFPYSLLT